MVAPPLGGAKDVLFGGSRSLKSMVLCKMLATGGESGGVVSGVFRIFQRGAGVSWKICPPKKSPGGDFLTDGDRETFAPRRFIRDHRL